MSSDFSRKRSLTGGSGTGSDKVDNKITGKVTKVSRAGPRSSDKRIDVKTNDGSQAKIHIAKDKAKDINCGGTYAFHIVGNVEKGGRSSRMSGSSQVYRCDKQPEKLTGKTFGSWNSSDGLETNSNRFSSF